MSVAWAAAYTWRDRVSEWGQILFAARGMLTAHTDTGLWVVPAHQAVWVPAGVRHSVEIAGGIALRALYLSPSSPAVRGRLPDVCRVVEISPLLREVLRRTMRLRTLDRRTAAERHLLDVLLDELTVLPLVPLDLPMPRDARGVRAAAWIRAEPAARHTLDEVARAAAASPRTLGTALPRRDRPPFRRLAAARPPSPRPATARRGGDRGRRRQRGRLREHQCLRGRLPPRSRHDARPLLQAPGGGGRRREPGRSSR